MAISATARSPHANEAKPSAGARLRSLDVFRGLTVAFMILVNNAGNWEHVYAPLRHAKWHGWTPTDLVFPFFLWIVGVSMTLSFARRISQGADRGELFRHALRRGVLIFLIGFAFAIVPKFDWEHVRIMGVLQRIGLCYILGSAVYLFLNRTGQVVVTVGLIAGYWALMLLYPVPGAGAGVLEPEKNFAHWFDSFFLEGHYYAGSKTWDPEGLASTFPATANVLLGALAGTLLRAGRIRQLGTLGAALAIGGLLADASFPINKPIWSSSYVLLTCGLATLLFLALRFVIDGRGLTSWALPFERMGMNALILYVGSGILARVLSLSGAHASLWTSVYSRVTPLEFGSMLFALSEVVIFLLLGWWLWSRRIFVKL